MMSFLDSLIVPILLNRMKQLSFVIFTKTSASNTAAGNELSLEMLQRKVSNF